MIFCSRCDGSLDHRPFAHLHIKAFCNLCRVNVIFQQGKRKKKHRTKKAAKFSNHLISITMITLKIGYAVVYLLLFTYINPDIGAYGSLHNELRMKSW